LEQEKVTAKSNDRAAIPAPFACLDFTVGLVSCDAARYQVKNCNLIVKTGLLLDCPQEKPKAHLQAGH
jgi:hypothetical protein